jgi:hypothetical protein
MNLPFIKNICQDFLSLRIKFPVKILIKCFKCFPGFVQLFRQILFKFDFKITIIWLNKKRGENYLDNGDYISVIWVSIRKDQSGMNQTGRELK